MTEQIWKDWEEYNYGLQGISTGSCHNQMGMQDRKRTPTRSKVKEPKPKVNKKQRPKNLKSKSLPKKENRKLQILFFFIGLIASAYFMNEAGINDSVAYLVGGAFSGLICAAFYKVLLGVAIAAIGFGILSNL